MSTFPLRIVTPSGETYAGEIEYLSIDTPDGKEGFLRGALPRVVLLSAGSIDIKTTVLGLKARCGEGIVCVQADGVTVLTDECVFDGDDKTPPAAPSVESDGGLKQAKAKIAASIRRMRDKTDPDGI